MIIRSFYGLTQNPFDRRELELLPQQREIHETLKVCTGPNCDRMISRIKAVRASG